METRKEETPFRDLKVDDIKKLIDEGYDVVDVREDWEWNKGHVPGARHIVLNTLLANPIGAEVPRPHDLRVRHGRALCGGVRDGGRPWGQRRRELPRRHQGMERRRAAAGDAMTDFAPTTQVTEDATVKPEDVIEVLRQCFDPEIPVNIVDLGLIYDIAIKPARVDIKMTLTALGCPMAADVMADVRDHLLTLPGISDAGVDIVYEPVWSPERMSEEARWELGMV